MAIVDPPAPSTDVNDSFEDILERLGNVSLRRILANPPPGSATEADVLAAEARPRKRLCELVDGVLVEKAVGIEETLLTVFLQELIMNFVRTRNLGFVTGADGMLRLFPGQVRIPDIAFLSWECLPGRKRPSGPIPSVVPTLAVEVLSPSNTAGEMLRKRRDYFGAGVKIVWEIDIPTQSAKVYSAPEIFSTLNISDSLDGGDVLPGFRVALRDLLADLDRHD